MEKFSRSQDEADKKLNEDEAFIKRYLPLVKKIAARFSMRIPPSVSMDELISAGSIGLIDAAGKFDPDRHVNFETYASFRIRGSILDELRSLDNYSRSLRQKTHQIEKAVNSVEKDLKRPADEAEIAEEMGVELEEYQDMLKDVHSVAFFSLDASIRNSFKQNQTSGATFQDQLKGDDNPEKNINNIELKKVIAEAVDNLSDTEKKVITLYYYEDLTLKEIGEIFERTESRICQIHSSAVIKLKSKLNSVAS